MKRDADIVVRLGQGVRELRKAQGYSQEAFADECGLDCTYIGGIERGQRNVVLQNDEASGSGLSRANCFSSLRPIHFSD
jgi:transcriptional regulator with XRE-family HTH domain